MKAVDELFETPETVELVRRLASHPCVDLNAADASSACNSALMIAAVREGRHEIMPPPAGGESFVRAILACASVHARQRDAVGRDALDWATRSHQSDAVCALRAHLENLENDDAARRAMPVEQVSQPRFFDLLRQRAVSLCRHIGCRGRILTRTSKSFATSCCTSAKRERRGCDAFAQQRLACSFSHAWGTCRHDTCV